MKPQKMRTYASFAEWERDQSQQNRKLITLLSRLVKEAAPELTSSIKWGQGCWLLGDVPKIFIHAEPDHVQLGFYAGSKLKDPEGLLVGKGKYVRHVKISTKSDIRSEAFGHFIKQVL